MSGSAGRGGVAKGHLSLAALALATASVAPGILAAGPRTAGPPYATLPQVLSPAATFSLHDGAAMPIIGLGVYLSKPGDEAYHAVRWAIEAGYRLIDTAAIYRNEESVGKAISDSGVPRSELWITTKLADGDHGYDAAIAAFERSRQKLGLDYLDLYLIHSPLTGKLIETWDAVLSMQAAGRVRSVGVSNFGPQHLEALRAHGRPTPTVNQIEMHPMNYQERKGLLEYCKEHQILVQAYGSLFFGKTEFLQRPEVTSVVEAHPGRTAGQVLLRWGLQMGFQLIPKSVREQRIKENLEVLSFELTEEEMEKLSSMQGELGAYWQPISAPVDLGDTSRGRSVEGEL